MVGNVDVNLMIMVMFWTILAMMLVLIYVLKQVVVTQKHIENIDYNIEKFVKRIEMEEKRVIKDVEKKKRL